ncbi:MAG: hypothetical protein QOI01_4911 [Mycobacterium sp.]|nr:hypothetical protein [Mycobacterium sp.]
MSSDVGGPGGMGSPPYGPPGYPAPPYFTPPGYPPPGYGPPGYGYPPTAGPYGYPPMGAPPALKPGVIPLRPLSMSDIFNASVTYIRTNPKATLGLTTIVVVVTQVLALLIQVGPLAATGALAPLTTGDVGQEEISSSATIALLLSSAAGSVTAVLAGIVLSGLLTVVVGRAVFGATMSIGEAWQRVRGRLLALLSVTAIEVVGAALMIAVVVGLVVAVSQIVGGAAAFVVGVLFGLALVVLLVYLYTMLSFAPTLIVLERIGVAAAITRSFALVRNDFWRVFGIRLLAVVVAGVVSGAVSVPFSLVGQVMLMVGQTTATTVIAFVLISIGGAIGQIITSPFSAGVVVLLYTDRRIRAEAFDLVLQTGAAGAVASTDDLWLTPQR